MILLALNVNVTELSFLACLYRKSYGSTPLVSICGGMSINKILKFSLKAFYVMGKVLTDEVRYPVCRQVLLASRYKVQEEQ